jgi:hypothetical protein
VGDYLEPYRRAVDELGPGFESLLWKSRPFQETRFKVLLEVAASGLSRPETLGTLLRLEGRVIADLGSGRADLAAWMRAIGLRYGRYIGIEGVPGLAEASRERLAAEGVEEASIMEADFAADTDLFRSLAGSHGVEVVVFSGSLNTFEQAGAQAVIELAFAAMSGVRGGAVVYNFLSDLCRRPPHKDTGPARRFDTRAMIAHASRLSGRFVVRHDYLDGHDATIGLFAD